VALRGYRWFLGQIYGYPEGGVYFGVPLSNFAGWFLVALVLIRVLQYLISGPAPSRFWDWGRRPLPAPLLGSGLYLGILGFNLTMTFLIGETCLGWVGVFIYLPFLTWLALKLLP
jgi:putative membrane protein